MSLQQLLAKTNINPDQYSHISIKNNEICREQCEEKPCTSFCPTGVYSWNKEKKEIEFNYKQCIECMACPYGCPYHNISWYFPEGGHGVNYN